MNADLPGCAMLGKWHAKMAMRTLPLPSNKITFDCRIGSENVPVLISSLN
jgi:hypothetical protein